MESKNLSQWHKCVEGATCSSCRSALSEWTMKTYDHPEGWLVDGKKQWIYYECSCGYQTSLAKLGVSRP